MKSRNTDVTIVVPPFFDPLIPAIGATVIANACEDAGFSSRVYYANLDLWAMDDTSYNFVLQSPTEYLLGEALFSAFAFPGDIDAESVVLDVVDGSAVNECWGPEKHQLARDQIRRLQRSLDKFLDKVTSEILREGSGIIGFSANFHQTTAALAIANRVKAANPAVITVLGGANVEGEMAYALKRVATNIDVIFSGEADIDFPAFVREVMSGRSPTAPVIECSPVTDFNRVPTPRYEDYFGHVSQLPLRLNISYRLPTYLPFETSRGCWWGEKHHCTFCGLNGLGMKYRSKPTSVVLNELEDLYSKWGERNFGATDNIISFALADELLLEMQRRGLALNLFFETKANLSGERLDRFVRGGIRAIQPGIESLSSSILQRIRKGLTAAQAIMLLRDCASRQIEVYWNMFTRVPGDRDDDYVGLGELIKAIVHLRPPVSHGPIRVDRFSPYFDTPEAFGITALKPFGGYEKIFPSEADLERLAYHFKWECESDDTYGDQRVRMIQSLGEWSRVWNSRRHRPQLSIICRDSDGGIIQDTRTGTGDQFVFVTQPQMALLASANQSLLRRNIPTTSDLRELLHRRFIVECDDRYVTVVTDPVLGVRLRENECTNVDLGACDTFVMRSAFCGDQNRGPAHA